MPAKAAIPELKRYMDKRVSVQLNAARKVSGVLRGFDPFMNLLLDESLEETNAAAKTPIGMVILRGSSAVVVDALDKIS